MWYNATRPSPADGAMMNPQADARGSERVDFERYTYVEVALTPIAALLAANVVIADTQIVTGMAQISNEVGELYSLVLVDEDDVGAAVDVYFLDANVSLGTEGVLPSITDANARNILGLVAIATGDYKDLGGVKIAMKSNIGIIAKPATGTKDIYVGVVNGAGTPTYTAAGLRLRLGFKR